MEFKLVEKWILLDKINFDAEVEMAFKFLSKDSHKTFEHLYSYKPRAINTRAPRIRNLHPWPARRPCGIARVINLASILPKQTNRDKVYKALGFNKVTDIIQEKMPPIIFYVEPSKDNIESIVIRYSGRTPEEFIVVDPMAGGGSIPLESLRLGFTTIAMDYNPVAYLILKATLEYPAKYGRQLYEDVREESIKLIEYAINELGKYYTPDASNYIIARGYRCPRCNRLNPIIHSDKLGKNGPYIKILPDASNGTFNVAITSAPTEFRKLKCIYPDCGMNFDKNLVMNDWVERHKKLLDLAISGKVDKVEDALEELSETHILLVKQTSDGFRPCGDEDWEHFVEAFIDLARESYDLKQYIPRNIIPDDNDVFKLLKNYGVEKWYQLFNPRQLLMLSKLVRYIINKINEKINEGEYVISKYIYLAFGLDKLFNFNNITTTWDNSTKTIRELMDHYARSRKVDLGLEYCELVVPLRKRSLGWVFEPEVEKPTATHGGILPALKLLCSWLEGLGDRIEVYMGDATNLDGILDGRQVDVINVDPPYFDQHFYSDFSEFFWQILRLSLRQAIDLGYLFNTDPDKGRVELYVKGWSPQLPFIPRDREIIVRKSVKVDRNVNAPQVAERIKHTKDWYIREMWSFFRTVSKVLRDDGVLVVWFTHSDPDAWVGILASIYSSDFSVSKAWTVWTEMRQRRVALSGASFFTSLALICRKRELFKRMNLEVSTVTRSPDRLLEESNVVAGIMEGAANAFFDSVESKASPQEALIMTMAGAIAGATKVRNPSLESVMDIQKTLEAFLEGGEEEFMRKVDEERFRRLKNYFINILYPVAVYIGTRWYLWKILDDSGFDENMKNAILSVDKYTRAYILLWSIARTFEKHVVDSDICEKVVKLNKLSIKDLRSLGLLRKENRVIHLNFTKRDVFEGVGGKIELMGRTSIGRAILLIDTIKSINVSSPTDYKGAIDRTKKQLYEQYGVGVSEQDILVALFMLRNSNNMVLSEWGISEEFSKPFIEKSLLSVLGGGS